MEPTLPVNSRLQDCLFPKNSMRAYIGRRIASCSENLMPVAVTVGVITTIVGLRQLGHAITMTDGQASHDRSVQEIGGVAMELFCETIFGMGAVVSSVVVAAATGGTVYGATKLASYAVRKCVSCVTSEFRGFQHEQERLRELEEGNKIHKQT